VLAAGIPVWIILQPRDFTNSFLLYSDIIALFSAAIVASLKGVTFQAPAFNVAAGTAKLGPIWPAFGSANQLLASLALIAISVWLLNRGINALFTVVPAIFMMVITIYSLFVLLIEKYLPKQSYALSALAILMIILSIGVV
jgi:carbon starvation protein CstA